MFEAAKPAGFQVFMTFACGLLGNAFFGLFSRWQGQ